MDKLLRVYLLFIFIFPILNVFEFFNNYIVFGFEISGKNIVVLSTFFFYVVKCFLVGIKTKIEWLYVLFILFILISSFFSGFSERFVPSMLYFITPYLSLFLIRTEIEKISFINWLNALFILTLFLSLIELMKVDLSAIILGNQKFKSIFPKEEMVSSYYFSVYSLIYFLLYLFKKKKSHLIFFLISLLMTFLGQTRSYIIPLILTILIFYIYEKRGKLMVFNYLLICSLLAFIFTLKSNMVDRLLNSISSLYNYFYGGDYDIELVGSFIVRENLWIMTFEQFTLKSFLFGNGLGSSSSFTEQYFGVKSHFHNDALGLVFDIGLFGLIFYYFFVFKILAYFFKVKNKPRFIVFLFIFELLIGLTNTNLFIPIPKIVFFIGLLTLKQQLWLRKT